MILFEKRGDEMRKKPLFLFFTLSFFLSSVSLVFASGIEVESRITKVTVYPDSALVSRVAAVQLNPGDYQIIFTGLVPQLDENSIRVSGSGNAKVKILGAQLKKDFQEKPADEEVEKLTRELEALTDARRRLGDEREAVLEERRFVSSLKFYAQDELPKEMARKMPSVKEVSDLARYMTETLKNNAGQIQEIDLKIREIDRKISLLQRKLGEFSQPTQLKRGIGVNVSVEKAGGLTLEISYLVFGASWAPLYDARAEFDQQKVEVISYGLVRQVTGEDWKDVELTLSTSRPTRSGRLPDITSWFVRPYEPPQVLRRKDKMVAMADMEMLEEAKGFGPMAAQPALNALTKEEPAQMSYAQSAQTALSLSYKIRTKASVKSDGSEERLPIFSQQLKAEFKYAAYPKVSSLAYLRAHVTNALDLQMLPGRVNVFLDNEYVGASQVPLIGPGETFDLSLGVDESVKVKREILEKKVDETLLGNIPSSVKRVDFKYKITLENYKSRKIILEFFESLPVPQDDRIKVKIDSPSIPVKDKDWKDQLGVWRWEIGLEPRAKKEVYFSYSVEFPKSMRVEV